jgi:hypothetical protein
VASALTGALLPIYDSPDAAAIAAGDELRLKNILFRLENGNNADFEWSSVIYFDTSLRKYGYTPPDTVGRQSVTDFDVPLAEKHGVPTAYVHLHQNDTTFSLRDWDTAQGNTIIIGNPNTYLTAYPAMPSYVVGANGRVQRLDLGDPKFVTTPHITTIRPRW